MEGMVFEGKARQLVEMYKEKRFGTCAVCEKCKQDVTDMGQESLYPPVGAFFVGEKFDDQIIRLMFVGKVARGDYGTDYGSGLREAPKMWKHEKWAFWEYTRVICENVFGDDSSEHIAMTNIIQCNNSHDTDATTHLTKRHCVMELKALSEEIKIIKPNTIVFYTVAKYDDCVPSLFDEHGEITAAAKTVGKKTMPWRESVGVIEGLASKINVLRVGHPERLNKRDYTAAISEWVKRVNGVL